MEGFMSSEFIITNNEKDYLRELAKEHLV